MKEHIGQRGSLEGKKECTELNDNRNITCQDRWDAAKAVLRGKKQRPMLTSEKKNVVTSIIQGFFSRNEKNGKNKNKVSRKQGGK